MTGSQSIPKSCPTNYEMGVLCNNIANREIQQTIVEVWIYDQNDD